MHVWLSFALMLAFFRNTGTIDAVHRVGANVLAVCNDKVRHLTLSVVHDFLFGLCICGRYMVQAYTGA